MSFSCCQAAPQSKAQPLRGVNAEVHFKRKCLIQTSIKFFTIPWKLMKKVWFSCRLFKLTLFPSAPQLPDIPVLEYLRQPFINWINSRGLLLSYECLVLFCKFNYIGISSLIVLQDVPSNAAGEELPFLSKDDCNYYMQGCKTLFYFELNWLEWRHAFFLIKINPNFGRKLSLHHHSLSYEMILLV